MSSTPVGLLLLIQFVLIAINAFFAAAEIAIVSLSEGKLRHQAEDGDKKANTLLKLVTEPSGFLSTIQIAITLAGFLGSAFASDNFSDMLVDWMVNDLHFTALSPATLNTISVIAITLILSYFTLVLGELVPKRIAMKKGESVARFVCGPVWLMSRIFRPIVKMLTLSVNVVLIFFGVDPKAMIAEAKTHFADASAHTVTCLYGDKTDAFAVDGLAAGSLQGFIDDYLTRHPEASVDYIHGEDTVKELTAKDNAVGFLFDGIRKDELFPYVEAHGALPRKTFSMGEANEKRYYIEARKIVK